MEIHSLGQPSDNRYGEGSKVGAIEYGASAPKVKKILQYRHRLALYYQLRGNQLPNLAHQWQRHRSISTARAHGSADANQRGPQLGHLPQRLTGKRSS